MPKFVNSSPSVFILNLCWCSFFSDRPRDTLVVFLSGVAGATVFLLLFLLASRVCKRQRRKRKFSLEKKKREEQDEGNKIKSVTIEIQGSDDETKEINVNPGDIIIIDHNDVNRPGSEDLGYLSEIVRFYNSQNIGSDDQISIRKQFSTCDSPSVISTEASESRDSKYGSVGTKQCTCRHDSLLRPSSPLSIIWDCITQCSVSVTRYFLHGINMTAVQLFLYCVGKNRRVEFFFDHLLLSEAPKILFKKTEELGKISVGHRIKQQNSITALNWSQRFICYFLSVLFLQLRYWLPCCCIWKKKSLIYQALPSACLN